MGPILFIKVCVGATSHLDGQKLHISTKRLIKYGIFEFGRGIIEFSWSWDVS